MTGPSEIPLWDIQKRFICGFTSIVVWHKAFCMKLHLHSDRSSQWMRKNMLSIALKKRLGAV